MMVGAAAGSDLPAGAAVSEALVLSSQEGAVRTLTLNRPEVLNSFNTQMHAALLRALQEAAEDRSVRCLVLTGAGRAFCAGQDLADAAVEPGALPKDLGAIIERGYRPLVERLRTMPVPTLAAVNGVAAGAGASLALHCDLVIAAGAACFIQAFSKVGLIPDSGGTWLLPRLIGRARALGLAMLGEKLPAAEAERIGLIWKSVPDSSFALEVQQIARRLADMPVKALVATRALMDTAQGLTLGQALEEETRVQRELGFAHDYAEGAAAFVAKRSPRYCDR
jgi:2-(1,2-epoxy-1,2-dihydrophenyl)acetyl-CoA isomerase